MVRFFLCFQEQAAQWDLWNYRSMRVTRIFGTGPKGERKFPGMSELYQGFPESTFFLIFEPATDRLRASRAGFFSCCAPISPTWTMICFRTGEGQLPPRATPAVPPSPTEDAGFGNRTSPSENRSRGRDVPCGGARCVGDREGRHPGYQRLIRDNHSHLGRRRDHAEPGRHPAGRDDADGF